MPAGAITLVPGREGIGKSLTLVWLTARITRGELPGLHHGTSRPVIYCATEDSWAHTIVPRLIAAGADLNRVYRVEVKRDEMDADATLTLPTDCAALTEVIGQRGVALLALDPIMSVMAGSIDTHRDREVRTALEPLAALADKTGCAVAGLAHFNKSASTDVSNLITGSRAFSAVTRAVIAIARDPDAEDGSCVLSQAKNNLGRMDLPSLRYVVDTATVDTDEGSAYVGRLNFTGESDRSVADILGDSGDADERSERDEAADWLHEYLTDPTHGGEASAADVLKAGTAAGYAKRTLQRARKRAGVTSQRSGFGQGSTWSIDPSAPQSRHPRQDTRAGTNDANGGTNGQQDADVIPLRPEGDKPA